MQNKIGSVTLGLLLCLAGCAPSPAAPVAAPTVRPPTNAPLPTGTPMRAPASATPAGAATPTPAAAPTVGRPLPSLDLQAPSAILLEAATGQVRYAKNAHQKMYPASTTKIMTAALALQYFKTDEIIRVGEEANLAWTGERVDAQKAGLYYGQELTMQALLYGLLLDSGSDAAFTIAVNVARRASGNDFLTVDEALAEFSALMNQTARSHGALETHFANPDGMPDAQHYSTAYDLALIARAAMQDPRFRAIVATPVYTLVVRDGDLYSRTWENTNRLLQPQDGHYYAPANGIKTGTTPEAGYCLVSSALVGDKLVIAVVLNSTQEGVWSDSVALLKYANDDPR